MKVIAIDTSNKAMAVALADKGQIVAVKKINIKRNHSIQLMPTIEELVKEVKWQPTDIERIAVANGPGSYTGVRIAVTTAKALAWSLKADLITYSSLESMVLGQPYMPDQLLVPLFDARRGHVYTGMYRLNAEGKLTTVVADRHIDFESWMEELVGHHMPVVFVGEDANGFSKEIDENKSLKTLGITIRSDDLPQVEAMALDAPNRMPVSSHDMTPNYLKLTEAEENWIKDNPHSKRGHLVEKVKGTD
ncbi:MAG TPA: tRNA (adenosine(37)-N6)-threonylcarbamoyltransferase complex dimerization subunit type 1 TsaB [Alloiococcus sp.]|nr:tRNA (adenosine(37)-N6)-threonylcarbamoyltransferase complex dimerization subunit type 1 TsaB [Alloiococcus sp.]